MARRLEAANRVQTACTELKSIDVAVRGVSFPPSTRHVVGLAYLHTQLSCANVADCSHLAFSLVAPSNLYLVVVPILAKLQVIDVKSALFS